MSNDNKAVLRRYFESMDKQDFAACRAMFTSDFVGHPGGMTMPADGFEQMGRMFYAAFPDGTHQLHTLIAEGDVVCARFTFTGTHDGNFMGIAPTGKRGACSGIMVARVAGGKIAESWSEFDQDFMKHSGIV